MSNLPNTYDHSHCDEYPTLNPKVWASTTLGNGRGKCAYCSYLIGKRVVQVAVACGLGGGRLHRWCATKLVIRAWLGLTR